MSTVKITCGHKLIPGDKLFCNHCVDEITSLLGRERDEFGKKEIELLAKLAVAREALADITNTLNFPEAWNIATTALAKLDEAK